MASLVLGIVGAALGGAVGGKLGMEIGWLGSAALDNAVFQQPKVQTQESDQYEYSKRLDN